MRKLLMLAAAGVLFSGVGVLIANDDTKVTITGDGMCGKCALKETKSCQNVVIEDKDGKKTTYYLKHEGVSKDNPRKIGLLHGHQRQPGQGEGHRHRRGRRRQEDLTAEKIEKVEKE